MALRHAVLAALLDGEYSGYQLAKTFDTGVANFWPAVPQQLYAELSKLDSEGLVTGRTVVQHDRPNKRVYTVNDAGLAELERFAATEAKHFAIRDDLLVKVYAVDHTDHAAVIEHLTRRAAMATEKIALYDRILAGLRGDLDEKTFLRNGKRVGPYLTCLRGRQFEAENLDWCRFAADLLRDRATDRATTPADDDRSDTA